MTQPPNPGQPFYQQQPSAPSAPAPGQPYPPQQQFQGAPGAPAAPGAPGQPFPQAPAGDSFMGNLFDTAKPFAEKFGKVFFYIAAIALVLGMGLPTTANYILMSALIVPIIARIAGLDATNPAQMLPVHMFVFYFGIMADSTPPVALAAFAGWMIAGAGWHEALLIAVAVLTPQPLATTPAPDTSPRPRWCA